MHRSQYRWLGVQQQEVHLHNLCMCTASPEFLDSYLVEAGNRLWRCSNTGLEWILKAKYCTWNSEILHLVWTICFKRVYPTFVQNIGELLCTVYSSNFCTSNLCLQIIYNIPDITYFFYTCHKWTYHFPLCACTYQQLWCGAPDLRGIKSALKSVQ